MNPDALRLFVLSERRSRYHDQRIRRLADTDLTASGYEIDRERFDGAHKPVGVTDIRLHKLCRKSRCFKYTRMMPKQVNEEARAKFLKSLSPSENEMIRKLSGTYIM